MKTDSQIQRTNGWMPGGEWIEGGGGMVEGIERHNLQL